MQLTNTLLLLTAVISVSAHPSIGLAHRHDKRTPHQFKHAVRPSPDAGSNVNAAAVQETTTTTTSSSSTSTTTSSSSSQSSKASSGTAKSFCSGSSKRASSEDIFAVGNTGTAGNWGCNIMQIDTADVDLYDYTVTFTAGSEGPFTCECWNKIGPDGGLSGSWKSALSLTVPKGGSVAIATEADTQGGCSCGSGSSCPKTPPNADGQGGGQWAGTWVEFDNGSKRNSGNSGSDVSVLAATDHNMAFPGMQLAANGKVCSWIKSTGESKDAYKGDMHDLDGVGCKDYYKAKLAVFLGDDFTG